MGYRGSWSSSHQPPRGEAKPGARDRGRASGAPPGRPCFPCVLGNPAEGFAAHGTLCPRPPRRLAGPHLGLPRRARCPELPASPPFTGGLIHLETDRRGTSDDSSATVASSQACPPPSRPPPPRRLDPSTLCLTQRALAPCRVSPKTPGGSLWRASKGESHAAPLGPEGGHAVAAGGCGQPGPRGPKGLTGLVTPGARGAGGRRRRRRGVWELPEQLGPSASGPGRGGKLTPGRECRQHSSKAVAGGGSVRRHSPGAPAPDGI